ncbi:MAG: LytR C-terminal domain-containing protein [Motilibacteraceae bacterium]
MNELDTRDRRGAHRMQRGPVQALVPGLLAVAAVAALVVAVLVMRGTAPSTTTTAAAGATSTPQATTSAAAGGSPSSVASASSSADATGSAAPTDSAAASPTPTDASATPGSTGEGTATDGVKSSAVVVVLNQTRISGLAGQVAQTLRSAGWTVSGTGNFSGNVPATTVYYPEGMQAAAEALAADVPGPDRVRPRFGNLSKDKLTVIVTSAAG